jgi:hypothetical protein
MILRDVPSADMQDQGYADCYFDWWRYWFIKSIAQNHHPQSV